MKELIGLICIEAIGKEVINSKIRSRVREPMMHRESLRFLSSLRTKEAVTSTPLSIISSNSNSYRTVVQRIRTLSITGMLCNTRMIRASSTLVISRFSLTSSITLRKLTGLLPCLQAKISNNLARIRKTIIIIIKKPMEVV